MLERNQIFKNFSLIFVFFALLVKLVPEWSYEPKIPRGNLHFSVKLRSCVLVYFCVCS